MATLLSDEELVKRILIASRLSEYDKESINIWMNDIQDYMRQAGVHELVMSSDKAIGALAIGVNDSRFFGAGKVDYSSAFKERVIQLTFVDPKDIKMEEADG